MNELQKYQFKCTLTFGDIYAQVIVWLIVIFISLATALALWSSDQQTYAIVTMGLILVISLPFLLFAFVTTLLNNIELMPLQEEESTQRRSKSSQRTKQTATSTS